MAQLEKFDAEEVFKKVGVKLHHDKLCGGPGGGAQGFGVQQTATVLGKDLIKEDPASWTNHGHVAEFLGGNVTNSGSVDVSKLSKLTLYKVFYYVSMKDRPVSSTVTLTLEFPDGRKQVSSTVLTVMPFKYQEVCVGKFMNIYSEGNITFTFTGDNGDTWKGLLIDRVTITPAN